MQAADPATALDTRNKYGVVLPHFGGHASRENILEGARAAERYGFDSVWVRDHLLYKPGRHEDPDRTHVDALVTLSAVAAVTSRITLGTATLIPHRNPVLAAMMLGSLDFLAGPDRVIAGWGIGNHEAEFHVVGMDGWDRREVLREQVQILRQLWRGETLHHAGRYYHLEDVTIHPVPGPGRPIPIWYGGASQAAVRRAVEYCDGWIAARIPRRDLRSRVNRLRLLSKEAGTIPPVVGVIPYVSPGNSRKAGLRSVDLPALFADTARRYQMPPSGMFQEPEDLDGALIVGPPDAITEEVRRYQAEGVQHFVFDMRLQFDRWRRVLELIGERVLPDLHRGDGR